MTTIVFIVSGFLVIVVFTTLTLKIIGLLKPDYGSSSTSIQRVHYSYYSSNDAVINNLSYNQDEYSLSNQKYDCSDSCQTSSDGTISSFGYNCYLY